MSNALQTLNRRKRNSFALIERIFTQNGMVIMQLRDGKSRVLTLKQAAERGRQVNPMLTAADKEVRDSAARCMDMLMPAIRACKAFHDDAIRKQDRDMQFVNFADGKDKQGNVLGTVQDQDEEAQVTCWQLQYPLVESDELRAMYRAALIPFMEKQALLKAMDHQRLNEAKVKHQGGDILGLEKVIRTAQIEGTAKATGQLKV